MSAAEQIEPAPFSVRFANDGDQNPIISSWLRGYLNARPSWVDHVDRARSFHEHQKLVKRILAQDETITLVAHDPEDEKHLMSWLCAELRPATLVLHFGYSFDFARGNGCFKALLAKVLEERGGRELVYTHRAAKAKFIAAKLGATFNPYRIFQ